MSLYSRLLFRIDISLITAETIIQNQTYSLIKELQNLKQEPSSDTLKSPYPAWLINSANKGISNLTPGAQNNE